MMYGRNDSSLSLPAKVLAVVIAGLMCAPEILPRRRMIVATVAPKTKATKATASIEGSATK
jgi:hypothetical protein